MGKVTLYRRDTSPQASAVTTFAQGNILLRFDVNATEFEVDEELAPLLVQHCDFTRIKPKVNAEEKARRIAAKQGLPASAPDAASDAAPDAD